jgi:CRP-like cAMP-binding protein
LRHLATGALPLLAVPGERIVVQGAEGDSLFVVAEGEVEVMVRQENGRDRSVDVMPRGAVFGEMALLTGERRNATVRAVDSALILEIGPRHYEPILRAHPEWIDDLAEMMSARLMQRRVTLARGDKRSSDSRKQKSTKAIRQSIYVRFFAD